MRVLTTILLVLCCASIAAAGPARPASARSQTSQELLFRWPVAPPALTGRTTSVRVDIQSARARILAAATSRSRLLLLRLSGVTAARQPGVVWRVLLRGPVSRSIGVGTVALYQTGLRTEHPFRPAVFSFPVDRAVAVSLAGGAHTLTLTFVPTAPLVNGKPSQPRPKAIVEVGRISFITDQR